MSAYHPNKIFADINLKVKIRSDGAIVILNAETNKFLVLNGIEKKLFQLMIKYADVKKVEEFILSKNKQDSEKVLSILEKMYFDLSQLGIVVGSDNDDKKLMEANNIAIFKDTLEHSLDEIFIEITKDCNLRCNHCYIDRKKMKDELATDEILNIIDQASNLGVIKVKITGGEPLIHKDFFKIVDYIVKKNLLLRVYTNGQSLTENNIKKLYKCGVRELQISVDGYYDDTHDNFRRTKGNLKVIKNALPLLNSIGFDTILSFTATDYNIDELKYFHEFLKEYNNVKINGSLFMNYHGQTDCDNMMLKISDETINKLKKYAYELQDVWSKKMAYGFTYPSNSIGYCGAGVYGLYVSSVGKVFMCPVLQQKEFEIGSVKESSLIDIWTKNELLNEFRKFDISNVDKCSSCLAFSRCRGGCRARAYLSNKNIYTNDPISCRMFL